jgi:5-enolpyruvylshikimate-3-phosphate synthase
VRAMMAGGIAVLLLATGAAGAEERYPVRSTDDASASFANRISAVGNVLTPLGARLERISADWFQIQPGPPKAPEQQALAGVYDAAVGIAFGGATILAKDYHPPNPVCED